LEVMAKQADQEQKTRVDDEPVKDLNDRAKAVLDINDTGDYTIPAEGLYPHQWLWDSCFIAIGLRHFDVQRAQKELLSLLRGQWANGMLPHMIFTKGDEHRRDRNIWRSQLSPFAPDNVATSGITQPPMLAEAVIRIGEKLKLPERRTWYQTMYPALLAYHNWLYTDRDPHGEGLILQIHPYETGLDNTPPWINQLRMHHQPWWAKVIDFLHLEGLISIFRRDTKHVAPGERMSNIEALIYYNVILRLRRKQYNTDLILNRSMFAVEDLTFNCIVVRANHCLRSIAKAIKHTIPEDLQARMDQSEQALDQLWDGYSGQYYSRNFVSHKLIKEDSIATLMPLYAGTVTKERAEQLVRQLHDKHRFGAFYPVPSVPLNSPWFKPHAYWQGPTWINTNWLIIDGLKRYGYHQEADIITRKSIELVDKAGCYEYFSPIDGSPAGAPNFSWTAALTIDLLQS